MKQFRTIWISSVLLLAPVVVNPVVACECGWVQIKDGKRLWTDAPPPLSHEEYVRYPAVFEGKVTSVEIQRIPTDSCDGCFREDVLVTFAVQKVWKGDVAGQYPVRTPHGGPACEYPFTLGERYLVYVKEGTKDSPYGVTRCSRTKLSAEAGKEVAMLNGFPPADGPGKKRRNP